MIYLRFEIAGQIYALARESIDEVIPFLQVHAMAHTSPAVVGTLNYRAKLLPVIDLAVLFDERSSNRYASTRMVVVSYREVEGEILQLALIAEQATEIMKLEDSVFNAQVINNGHIPYSGATTLESGQLLYRLEVQDILPLELQAQLYPQYQLDRGPVKDVD